MSEEPSLPRLPAVSWDEQSQSFSNQPRKRHRISSRQGNPSLPLNFNSSDPAVFSSDDDPGLDNYVEGRHKRRYVGSWFQQQLESPDSASTDDVTLAPIQTKRYLKRDFDSGVFLGSDATDDGEDLMEGLDLPALPRLPQLGTRAVPQLSQAEVDARRKIQECLDSGNETVDLMSMGLEVLSDDTVKRLSQIACIPIVARDVAFVQREPELKLFLASNSLTRLPSSLFDINHLTVLSLRGNQLTELPSAISKLSNLEQLNISQNRFKYLPAEFLDLFKVGGKFRDLSLFVNPFLQPEQATQSDGENGGQSLLQPAPYASIRYKWLFDDDKVPRYLTRWLGRSPLQISDSNGQILSEFRLPSGEESSVTNLPVAVGSDQFGLPASISSQSPLKETARPSVVPSLIELALQSCYRTSQLRELESYIPEGLSHLQKLLQRASRQRDNGGVSCSTCGKTLVVPRLEWIEWREICRGTVLPLPDRGTTNVITRPFTKDETEMAVPFLYRACSWRCGPKDSEKNKWWSLGIVKPVEEAGSQGGRV